MIIYYCKGKMMNKLLKICVFSLVMLFSSTENSLSCSKIVFQGSGNTVIVGRSLDWASNDEVTLRILPRGEERNGHTKQNPIVWKSKYGSLVLASKDKMIFAGVNEKNLSADSLWLGDSEYGDVKENEQTLSALYYVNFILDNFASVDEAVNYLENTPIRIVTSNISNSNEKFGLHYSITDENGESAVIEYHDGNIKIYRMKGKMVMTNDPTYEKMTAILDYYKERGLFENMPGSSHGQSRFLRASGWLDQLTDELLPKYASGIENSSFRNQATMSVLSVMRAVSTPLGISPQVKANNETTVWRYVADLKNHRFYFDSGLNPTMFWIDWDNINFVGGNRRIDLRNGRVVNGDATKLFNYCNPIE